jgi:uncharacterized RDD family membrane protein YckC
MLMEIRSIQTIQTVENIPLHVELAGIANRFFAFLIDFVFIGILVAGAMFGLFLGQVNHASPGLIKTLTPLVFLILPFSYHFFQEWLWNGKTVGKSFLNLRVVRTNGQAIGFWEAFGRNLLRLVDVYVSGIGLPCMMANQGEKRFGDFLAGTMVIVEHGNSPFFYPESSSQIPANKKREFQGVEEADNTSIPIRATRPSSLKLQAEEVDLLRSYLLRRGDFLKESRQQLTQDLCQYFSEKFQLTDCQFEEDLETLLREWYQSTQPV